MPDRLRILVVDDDPLDAELEIAALQEAGYTCDWEVAATREDFLRKLENGRYDLVLSDYRMPQFDGLSALKLFVARNLKIPFILISGTVGEEVAIECLKAGATDYVLKTRLSRLALVVSRALQEREEQRRRQRAEDALRLSEEQLRHAQKMEAIGRLAGGVAHDFNNLLMVMMGYTELLLERLHPGDPLRDHAHQVWNAGQKATAVTQQLLAFSRKQAFSAKVLDMNSVLADLGKMLPRLIGEDVVLTLAPASELASVLADRGHLEQVLMNLVVNARDAMPRGGRLRIETANVSIKEDDSNRPASVPAGDYVRLSVQDTGTGMDETTLTRIFEPFFTTKEVGKGTGLGLATVYGIVQQNGGYIDVKSRMGDGTTFSIYMPVVKPTADAGPEQQPAAASPSGRETILLVEDEDGVRSLVMAVLQAKGYHMLEAASPSEALRISDSYSKAIELLITDVVLPEMTGREVAERLRGDRPEMKALFMSGYTNEKILEQGGFHAGTPFLQKPFSTETLAWKVRELLDSQTIPALRSTPA